MKKFILIFAFAALCFSGCKKDIVPPPDPGPGIESRVVSPRSSSLDKVVKGSVAKNSTDPVLIAADLRKTK